MSTRTHMGWAAVLGIAACSTAVTNGCNSQNVHPGHTEQATSAPARPASPALPNGTTAYVDPADRFRFAHASGLAVSADSTSLGSGWRVDATTNGVLLAQVTIPRESQPNTNFAGAKLTVGKSADPAAVRECSREAPGEQVRTATVSLHGRTFTALAFSEAAAGNFYETTSYRTVEKGECWAVEYTVHSTNLANYSPDQHVSAFDRAKVAGELDAMARSFELP